MGAPYNIKFRFNPSSESTKVLGPLESEIMRVVWDEGSATVSAVHKALQQKKEIAYTTVMTTMTRLAKKHLLQQDTTHTSYVYTPTLSRADFDQYVITGVLNGLFDDYGDAVLAAIVECVKARDGASERLVKLLG